jgi:RNase P subunit RPR2
MEIRRMVCKNCGKDVSFSLSSQLKEASISIFGKCPFCGSTIQLEILPKDDRHPDQKEVDINEINMPQDTNLDDILS